MKKIFFTAGVSALLLGLSACMHNNKDISISVSEKGDMYSFSAKFPKEKTEKVEQIMAENLAPNTIMTGGTKMIDAMITLDDKTHFYMKAEPGDLSIKFDRYENTKEAYVRMRKLCEDIKVGLTK